MGSKNICMGGIKDTPMSINDGEKLKLRDEVAYSL
jgi:hypothetical protein